jgi:hypothetical protein
MIRLIAFAAFALALATSAQAMPLTPLHQSDGMITQVRHACGAGAWCGVRGTFAVSGVETPAEPSWEGIAICPPE